MIGCCPKCDHPFEDGWEHCYNCVETVVMRNCEFEDEDHRWDVTSYTKSLYEFFSKNNLQNFTIVVQLRKK